MSKTLQQFRRIRVISSILLLVLIAIPLLGQSPSQSSSVPHLVKYTGVVKDASGKPVTGTVGVTFALYADQQGGSPLWLETQNVQADAQGRYSVYVGATKSDGLAPELFVSGEARWLGVQPEGQAEQPRTQLISVPYAMKAGDAATIGGLPPSAFVLAAPAAAASGSTTMASSSSSAAPIPPPLAGTGTVNFVPLWTPDGNTLGNSVVFQSGTGSTARIGVNTTTPASTLDVKGGSTVRGTFALPAAGTATATTGKNSQPLQQTASSFNSGTGTAVGQTFRWQAEPSGNNTTTNSGTLNLLFNSGSNTPTETGLHIASNGKITFAAGQTFPGTGNGTITGVTAGTALTGGGTSGAVTLGLDTTKVPQLNAANTFTASQTVNGNLTASQVMSNAAQGTAPLQVASSTQVANLNASFLGGFSASAFQPVGSYATLGPNTFTGDQKVLGNISSNAQVSGSTVNAVTSYNIGGNPFAYGSLNTANEFFGFAGNQTMTGGDNVATGQVALLTNTTGYDNTAHGIAALKLNDTGSDNSAVGFFALFNNSAGSSNTALGSNALLSNTTGSNNTALGANAGPDSAHPALTNASAIGANAQVTASNALVLGSINGVNGATADTLVGIGTTSPAAKLDVHGNANFTGPITFAAGQTFPGTGTITGVTAGTGLSGGGTTGSVTLSLNNTYGDGRYAQLTANNTFSGVQTINNRVGIGTTPSSAFALQTIGTIRSETGGLSIGGNAPVSIDAPGIAGGRFTILPNGNVGINNGNPTTNLDVHGNINTSGTLIGGSLSVAGGGVINGGITTTAGITTGAGVTVGGPLSATGNTILGGSLRIGGDTPMTSNPHMSFSGIFPGSFCGDITCGNNSCAGAYCAGPGGYFVPDKNIVITRIDIVVTTTVDASCYDIPSVSVDFPGNGYGVNIFGSSHTLDSGPISLSVPAGAPITIGYSPAYRCNLGSSGGGGAFVNVQYVMQ